MLDGFDVEGKTILEPSAGSGKIVDHLIVQGAKKVIACELHDDLRKIVATKCDVIESDFFKVTSDRISHIDMIVMNPPFSNAADHILHAWNIAPSGCTVVALCNFETLNRTYRKSHCEVQTLIENYGSSTYLGECFSNAEHKTDVEVALIRIQKPADNYEQEFAGFFLTDEEEPQSNGIMNYNYIRDIVNRYVSAVKCWDEHDVIATRMNSLTSGLGVGGFTFNIGYENFVTNRGDFKKELQKKAWLSIFSKMNLDKYSTKGLKEDINKFVEKQTQIPFTMRNVYKMLEIIIGTTGSRMDKALLEVFDKLTQHYDDNRYNVEGWKTNSHYLMGKKFILPSLVHVGYHGEVSRNISMYSNFEKVEDFTKALCFIAGKNFSDFASLENVMCHQFALVNQKGNYINREDYDHDVKIMESDREKLEYYLNKIPGSKVIEHHIEWGQWFDWGFFRCKPYKKGTIHFEFKDLKLWEQFNARIAKLKGYPLFESKRKSDKKKEYTVPNQMSLVA